MEITKGVYFKIGDHIEAIKTIVEWCEEGDILEIFARKVYSGYNIVSWQAKNIKTGNVIEFDEGSRIHLVMKLKEQEMPKEYNFVKKQTVIMEGYHDDLDLIHIDGDFDVGEDEHIEISLSDSYYDAEMFDKLIDQLKILKSQAFPEAK